MLVTTLASVSACESRITARLDTATPATPVMIGSNAAHTERNTSSSTSRAARTPTISLTPPGSILVNALPPTFTLNWPEAAFFARSLASASCDVDVNTTVA